MKRGSILCVGCSSEVVDRQEVEREEELPEIVSEYRVYFQEVRLQQYHEGKERKELEELQL